MKTKLTNTKKHWVLYTEERRGQHTLARGKEYKIKFKIWLRGETKGEKTSSIISFINNSCFSFRHRKISSVREADAHKTRSLFFCSFLAQGNISSRFQLLRLLWYLYLGNILPLPSTKLNRSFNNILKYHFFLNKLRLPEPHLERRQFVFATIFVLKYNIVLNQTNINVQDTV